MKLLAKYENIYTVFQKEIIETLRDRRTLFVMTLLPVLLYPILMLGVTQLIIYKIGTIQSKKIPIAIEGESEKIWKLLENENFELIKTKNARREVNQEKAVLGLKIPANFDISIEQLEEIPRLMLFYSGASDQGQIVLRKLENILQRLLYKAKKEALKDSPPGFMHPFRLILKNVAGAGKQGAFEFGRLLSILLVLMAITFPLYPAIDMGAGEKERGTMETLLLSPATRSEIVIGKYGAIFAIAMVGSLLNLASMGLTFGYFANQSGTLLTANSSRVNSYSTPQIQDLYPVIAESEPTISSEQKISRMSLLSDDHLLTSREDGSVAFWYIPWEQQIQRKWPKLFREISSIVRYDRKSWILGTKNGDVIQYVPRENRLMRRSKVNGEIRQVVISEKGEQIAVHVKPSPEKKSKADSPDEEKSEKSTEEEKGERVYLIDRKFKKIASWETSGDLLALSASKKKILFHREGAIWICDSHSGKGESSFAGEKAEFFHQDEYILLVEQGKILIRRLFDHEVVFPEVASQEKKQPFSVSTMYLEKKDLYLFLGTTQGHVLLSGIVEKEGKFSLANERFLGQHRSSIEQLDISQDSLQCVSLDSSGKVKKWTLSSPIKFSISLSTILKMLIILIPLVGFFSALCLSLSIFARSYKEGQYYLTPLVIIIMPLVMVAFLPNMNLTPRFCLVPVSNVVLLYKELMLDSATAQQFFLVFCSTLAYAALALNWAVKLFQKENVLFRESAVIRWAFWRKTTLHPKVFPAQQAFIFFFLIMVLYHFMGPYIAQGNFLLGQATAMVFFLVAIPLVYTLGFRYKAKPTFSLNSPGPFSKFIATIAIALGALILSAILASFQQIVLPMDNSYLEQFQKPFLEALANQPLWILLLCIAIAPGICEEFFFRGMILSSLLSSRTKFNAITTTAFLFALMHLDLSRFTFTFSMGVCLGYLLVTTRSIIFPMFAHALSNGLVTTLSYYATMQKSGLIHDWTNWAYESMIDDPMRASAAGACISITLLYFGFQYLGASQRASQTNNEEKK